MTVAPLLKGLLLALPALYTQQPDNALTMALRNSPLHCRIHSQHPSSLDPEFLTGLSQSGYSYEVQTEPFSSKGGQLPHFHCAIVDWQEADKTLAQYYCDIAGSYPVLALIGPSQPMQEPLLYVGFDDFIHCHDVQHAAFALRVQRLVDRYRDPLSITKTFSPEAQLLQTVVSHLKDWVFIKDLDHRFLSVSEEYARSMDAEIDDFIGKNDLEVGIHPEVVLGSETSDWLGFWPQDDLAVATGESTIEQNPHWRVFSGGARHNRTIRAPLKNSWNEVYALLVCSEDVTQIVKTEEVLRERNAMLEKVTQEKMKAEHSRLMAELAVKAKNKFIATASHDLRQPLHALGLYLDVLDSKVKGDDEQVIIAKIKHASTALAVLFNRLLDLSRLDAGMVEVDLTHFPIATLVANLYEEFREVAAAKSLGINVRECHAIVYSDAVLLERILRNLIQNAVTYTDEGSVNIQCNLTNEGLAIDISDTGPGIAQYEQHAIFSEFYQLEHDGQKPTIGLGLGLAIVRRLVDLLGISFELNSEQGRGSTFSLLLPLGDENCISSTEAVTYKPQLSGKVIVLVDDDIAILEGMSSMLMPHKCMTIEAESAGQAIQKLVNSEQIPHIIVADYRLNNGETGDVAIERIRDEFNLDIPALIVTGDTSPDRLKEAVQSGCQLLHKPVKPEDLVFAISQVLIDSEQGEQVSGAQHAEDGSF